MIPSSATALGSSLISTDASSKTANFIKYACALKGLKTLKEIHIKGKFVFIFFLLYTIMVFYILDGHLLNSVVSLVGGHRKAVV